MDIKCVVCGEPWDVYHINHDTPPWVKKLFHAGAGCESCEGVAPAIPWEPQTISDLENGDEDPGDRLNALERFQEGKVPKWVRPEPESIWKCDGCGAEVITDPDFDPKKAPDLAYEWKRSHCEYSSHRHGYASEGETLPLEPAHIFGKSKVCEECLNSCDECGKSICGALEFGDPYDEGYSHSHPNNPYRAICTSCLEKHCEGCGEFGECKCLEEAILKVERRYDLDDVDVGDVHAWMSGKGYSTWGGEIKIPQVEEACVALAYLVQKKNTLRKK